MRLKLIFLGALIICLLFPPLSSPQVAVRDGRGQLVVFSRSPRRIISLAPNLTEILYFLEMEKEVVGVTDMCDYPEQVKGKPRIGGFNPSMEKIVSLQPELILATRAGNRPEVVSRLEELGFPVMVTAARSVEGIFQSIINIGKVVSKEALARQKVQTLRARAMEVRRRVKGLRRVRVLFLIWHDPAMSPGGDTYLNDLIRWAGGESITAGEGENIVRLTREEIVLRQPEVIIAPPVARRWLADSWRQWGSALPAFIKHRVYSVDEDLVFRPGPRIVDGLEQVARLIHPEAFR
ncbi:MAG: cobalamin-binding protein [Acidobacteriota bacterium]